MHGCFANSPSGGVDCTTCGLHVATRNDASVVKCACPTADGPAVRDIASPKKHEPCPHRGDVLREEKCQSCRGNTRVKVYQCSQHGECTWQQCRERRAGGV